MVKNKNIDIIIPYWGSFRLLKEAVDSILKQTDTSWHLTILDDHYPSTEAYEFYNNLRDPRITYIRHRKNKGITNNFNFAIKQTSADYCVIMGCDDRFLPNYVETVLHNIGDADFYQPGVQVINANGHTYLPLPDRVKRILRPKKAGAYSGEKLATSLCHGNWLYFPSITWRTSFLKNYSFDTNYKILEDVILEFEMLLDGAILHLDNTETFQYRRFAESLSSKEKSKSGIRFAEEKAVYNQFAEKFKKAGWNSASRAAKFRITSRINQLISR